MFGRNPRGHAPRHRIILSDSVDVYINGEKPVHGKVSAVDGFMVEVTLSGSHPRTPRYNVPVEKMDKVELGRWKLRIP